MLRMSSAKGTELFKDQLVGGRLPIFARRIVFALALIASEPNQFSHDALSLGLWERPM
jgi:hypothetical protein